MLDSSKLSRFWDRIDAAWASWLEHEASLARQICSNRDVTGHQLAAVRHLEYLRTSPLSPPSSRSHPPKEGLTGYVAPAAHED
ncbi:hypothetical protein PGT21_014214 [Puccinia graminis f. sp. tritici]|uniref:Uncharacterized protein n=1 Tax=Puccinia graminis f. sp. tritici TaxID=56615 RepID=A0A5B0MCP8_PUCGR|nr:hypothetical protein PGT21_014214 [Puccinia graminis f. sp. tritici]